jgi:hypothetical protein
MAAAIVGGVSTAINLGMGIFGASQAQAAQQAQADAQNTAIDKQWKYDLQEYKLKKQQILKQYGDTIKKIDLAAKNEQILANFKDANALDSYAQALKIKDLQQLAANNAYKKSEKLYETQLSLNEQAAQFAKETQFAALQEEVAKFAIANNNLIIENLLNSSKAQAKGLTGNASVKANQAFLAAKGAKQALSDKGLSSLQQNALVQLQKLQQDKNAADVSAFAQKLLPPQEVPDPLVPYKTPLSEYQYPDPPTKFDFGPIPQKGVANTKGGSWVSAFSNYLPSITSSANQLAQSIVNLNQNKQQSSGFDFASLANMNFGNFSTSSSYSLPSDLGFSVTDAFTSGLDLGSTLNISTPSN